MVNVCSKHGTTGKEKRLSIQCIAIFINVKAVEKIDIRDDSGKRNYYKLILIRNHHIIFQMERSKKNTTIDQGL
jgi:hypothetical protein